MSGKRKTSAWVALAVGLLVAAAGWAIFFVAPEEATMGQIQRIFYFHVASAWTGFLAFFVVFIANIAWLVRRRLHWDWLAVAAAEVGLVFTTVVLVTGPIWAKPVWGIWWTWDARLTSTFVLWLLYVGYLLLRSLIDEHGRRATLSAAYGIFAFLDVPIVYMSIRWWRTQHPEPVVMGGEGAGLDPTMRGVLLFTWVVLMALGALLIARRYRLEAVRHQAAELSLAADERA